jgi:PAS domain S-box-containing protein
LARDVAGIGIWERSVSEGTWVGSDQYFRHYGLPPRNSVMSYAEWLSLVHPEDRERERAYYGNVTRATHPLESEYRVVWPDGSVHWLLSKANVAHCDPAGHPVRIVGINLEITRLKQAEQARREFEKRFRLLIEHGLEVIGVGDAAGNVRYVSPSVERVFGYQADSVVGTNAFQLIHPDDRPAVRQAIETILQAPDRSASVQFRCRHSNGAWLQAECAATNCLHIAGLDGIVVNVRDITPQKIFKEQLQTSRHRLRQLATSIESTREEERLRISREIHDELGQVLSVLKLDLEGLAFQHCPRDVTGRKDLSERVAGLVRNIDVSINTVHRIAAELRPSILNDLGLSAALKWQLQEFKSRTGIPCRCQGLREGLRLGAENSLAVFRIFQEILTNVVRHAEAHAVSIRVTTKGGWLTLRVADDGKGLDPKHLSDSQSLGLLGMRERALLLGGRVDFSARRGGGTVVTVRVPAFASGASPAPIPSVQEH